MIVCLFACYYYYYLTQYAHARTMPVSYAYVKGRGTKGGQNAMGTVIVSIDTAPVYTLHPPVIRA